MARRTKAVFCAQSIRLEEAGPLRVVVRHLRGRIPEEIASRGQMMKTDKQVYRIFAAVPDWVFQLAALPSPGRCEFRSVTIKALERNADGMIVPEASDQPLTVIEFQFQKDGTWNSGCATRARRRSRSCCLENYPSWKRPNPGKT